MHIAWSANDWANFGPIALRSAAVFAHTSTASWSGLMRAATESSFGRPSRAALTVFSSLVGSTAILASKSIVSFGSVHSAWTDALTAAAALHSPAPLEPPVPADAAPAQPAPAFADALASTLQTAGVYLILSFAPAFIETLRLSL